MFRFLAPFCLGILFLLQVPLSASAQPIPGAEAPAFIEARDLWLAGQDLPALQALAGLAREDNTAAQMLLSQIAMATHTHAHVTEGMERRARIALLRREGGLSGRDWMAVAAEAHPLALAIASTRFSNPFENQNAVVVRTERLISSSQRHLGFVAGAQLLFYGGDAFWNANAPANLGELGRPGRFLSFAAQFLSLVRARNDERQGIFVLYLPISELAAVAGDEEAFMLIFEASGPTAQYASALGARDEDAIRQERQLRRPFLDLIPLLVREYPDLSPLDHFCAEFCPLSRDQCVTSGAEALSIAGAFPYPLESPVPALIPDREYWASARFPFDLTRRLRTNGWPICGF